MEVWIYLNMSGCMLMNEYNVCRFLDSFDMLQQTFISILHVHIIMMYCIILTTAWCESQPILTGGAFTAFFPFDLLASCAARRERWNDSFSTVGEAVPWRLPIVRAYIWGRRRMVRWHNSDAPLFIIPMMIHCSTTLLFLPGRPRSRNSSNGSKSLGGNCRNGK